MKKALSLLVAFVLLGAFATNAWAYDFSAKAPSGQTLYYNIYGSTVKVTYPGENRWGAYWNGYSKPTGNLVVPSSVTYNGVTYPVTGFEFLTFYQCSGLTSVTIPDAVSFISNGLFYGCSGLTELDLPANVRTIGGEAFRYCNRLEIIRLRSQPPLLDGENIFDGTGNLTFIIPSGTLSAYQSKKGWGRVKKYVEY